VQGEQVTQTQASEIESKSHSRALSLVYDLKKISLIENARVEKANTLLGHDWDETQEVICLYFFNLLQDKTRLM
jgi:hypothetical protein